MAFRSFLFGIATGAGAFAAAAWYLSQPIPLPSAQAQPVPVQKPVRDRIPRPRPSATWRDTPREVRAPRRDIVDRFSGRASYYAASLDGRPTASGEPYRHRGYTAAHPSLPFGTQLLVTRRDTRQVVFVTVNDRGPYTGNRVLDLSGAAAEALGMMNDGVVVVDVEVLGE